MKPSSIIFLIVSVVIIIAGLVLCSAGINTAKEQNVALFETDVAVVDGDVIRTEVFNTEITKVKMTLTDVSVSIAPSETGETYLELRNFRLGTYDASVQNKILIIDNSTSIFSIMHLAEGSFNFRGLRHYLTDKTSTNTAKSVCLYLAPESDIKNFDITCSSGYISVADFSTNTDYNISVLNGSIKLENIATRSNITLSTDNGYVVLNNLRCSSVNAIIGKGGIDALFQNCPNKTELTVQNGNIYAAYKLTSLYGISLELDASGRINHAGEDKENTHPLILQEGTGGIPQQMTALHGDIYTNVNVTDITHIYDALLEIIPEAEQDAKTDAKKP